MSGRKHIVVYSHGFGVRKDDRGLFPDIAAALPDSEHVMFDYNTADESANTLTVAPFDKQVDKLKEILAQVQGDNPDAVIDLVCHSQGCVVAGLLKPRGIRKIVLTGPPATLSAERMFDIFGKRPGSRMDMDGASTFSRKDGSTTIVPSEYWASIQGIDPIGLYNELASTSRVTVVNANQDEVLGSSDFSGLSSGITVVNLDADHNFTGQARNELMEAVSRELGMKSRIVIVNEQDKVIGHRERGDVKSEDIYRVSALWVTNTRGDILLAQRAFTKSHDPGRWGPAVAGTVDEGETYEQNIVKETEEEIGIKDVNLSKGPKIRMHGQHNYFDQWYSTVIDKPTEDFTIQEEEVEQVKWFTREELDRELREHPERYLEGLRWCLDNL